MIAFLAVLKDTQSDGGARTVDAHLQQRLETAAADCVGWRAGPRLASQSLLAVLVAAAEEEARVHARTIDAAESLIVKAAAQSAKGDGPAGGAVQRASLGYLQRRLVLLEAAATLGRHDCSNASTAVAAVMAGAPKRVAKAVATQAMVAILAALVEVHASRGSGCLPSRKRPPCLRGRAHPRSSMRLACRRTPTCDSACARVHRWT